MKPKHNASKIVKRIINAARMYQQDVVMKNNDRIIQENIGEKDYGFLF